MHAGLSTPEVERLTGITRWQVRRLIDRGELRGFRVGAYRRVLPEELLRYLRGRGLPTEHTEALLAPPSCPSVLVGTAAPCLAAEWRALTEDLSVAGDLFQLLFMLVQRDYQFIVIDTAFGWTEVDRLLGWLARYRSEAGAGCLVYDDDGGHAERWKKHRGVRRWHHTIGWPKIAAELASALGVDAVGDRELHLAAGPEPRPQLRPRQDAP